MAVKNSADGTAIQKTTAALPPGFTDDMMAEAAASEGAGTSKATDDNIVPFLSLLQDNSPEAKKRDPKYIEGAEPGFIVNKASKRVYDVSKPIADIETPLIFVPCAFQRVINEWIPRDSGGGFVARFPLKGTPEQTMKDLGGKQIADPKDPNKKIWRLDNGHDLIDTRYHYGFEVAADDSWSAAVISFSSTGHTVSRNWMTLMNNQVLSGPGGKINPPSWFKKYRVRSVPKKNTKGDFFVLQVDDLGDAGWVMDARMRAAGKVMNESVDSGRVSAAADEDSGSGAAADGDIGI